MKQFMKKMVIMVAVFSVTKKAFTQNTDTTASFAVEGIVAGAYSGMMYLSYVDDKYNYVSDSTLLKKGSLNLKGVRQGKLPRGLKLRQDSGSQKTWW